MRFKIGDRLAYPFYGAGVVEDITECEILGEKREYYVLAFTGNSRNRITVTGDMVTSNMLDLSMYLTPSREINARPKAVRITSAVNSERTAHKKEKMTLFSGSTARSIHTFFTNSLILLNNFFIMRFCSDVSTIFFLEYLYLLIFRLIVVF